MNIAIVGCGLIGQKRAQALFPHHLVACADRIRERAEALARAWPGCQAFDDWRPVVVLANVDIVIVATTHESLAEITLAAVLAGKHVLVEKPGARHADELKPVASAARNNGILSESGLIIATIVPYARPGQLSMRERLVN